MHPDPMSAQKRRFAPCEDHAFASMTPPVESVSSRYPKSKIVVRAGPRGTVSDTTANASVMPPASANPRCRSNRLIRLSFYGRKRRFSRWLSFGLITFVTRELGLVRWYSAVLARDEVSFEDLTPVT